VIASFLVLYPVVKLYAAIFRALIFRHSSAQRRHSSTQPCISLDIIGMAFPGDRRPRPAVS